MQHRYPDILQVHSGNNLTWLPYSSLNWYCLALYHSTVTITMRYVFKVVTYMCGVGLMMYPEPRIDWKICKVVQNKAHLGIISNVEQVCEERQAVRSSVYSLSSTTTASIGVWSLHEQLAQNLYVLIVRFYRTCILRSSFSN